MSRRDIVETGLFNHSSTSPKARILTFAIGARSGVRDFGRYFTGSMISAPPMYARSAAGTSMPPSAR